MTVHATEESERVRADKAIVDAEKKTQEKILNMDALRPYKLTSSPYLCLASGLCVYL